MQEDNIIEYLASACLPVKIKRPGSEMNVSLPQFRM